jgi:hypothetical protein
LHSQTRLQCRHGSVGALNQRFVVING